MTDQELLRFFLLKLQPVLCMLHLFVLIASRPTR